MANEEKSGGSFHTDILQLFSQWHLDKLVTHFLKVIPPALDASSTLPLTATTQDHASSSTDLSALSFAHVAQPQFSHQDKEDHCEWSRLSETMAKESYCPPVSDQDGHTYVMQAHIC